MLTIEYDQALVEQATFLAARRDAQSETELHSTIDPLYELVDDEHRQRSFQTVFRDFFRKLGLDRVIADLIAEHPLIRERVGRCFVREAARVRTESAELFAREEAEQQNPQGRTLVIQVCPQSLVEPERFAPRMRRELLHVSDMLDERFGYDKETIARGHPGPRGTLLRDRYRILWDIYVEGRLSRVGPGDSDMLIALESMLNKVYPSYDAQACRRGFQRVFDVATLTHAELLAFVRNPDQLFNEPVTNAIP